MASANPTTVFPDLGLRSEEGWRPQALHSLPDLGSRFDKEDLTVDQNFRIVDVT